MHYGVKVFHNEDGGYGVTRSSKNYLVVHIFLLRHIVEWVWWWALWFSSKLLCSRLWKGMKSRKHASLAFHTRLSSPPSAFQLFYRLALQLRTFLINFAAGTSPMKIFPLCTSSGVSSAIPLHHARCIRAVCPTPIGGFYLLIVLSGLACCRCSDWIL